MAHRYPHAKMVAQELIGPKADKPRKKSRGTPYTLRRQRGFDAESVDKIPPRKGRPRALPQRNNATDNLEEYQVFGEQMLAQERAQELMEREHQKYKEYLAHRNQQLRNEGWDEHMEEYYKELGKELRKPQITRQRPDGTVITGPVPRFKRNDPTDMSTYY